MRTLKRTVMQDFNLQREKLRIFRAAPLNYIHLIRLAQKKWSNGRITHLTAKSDCIDPVNPVLIFNPKNANIPSPNFIDSEVEKKIIEKIYRMD